MAEGSDTHDELALQSGDESGSEADESLAGAMVARAGPSQIPDDEPTDDELTDLDDDEEEEEQEEEELGGGGGGDSGSISSSGGSSSTSSQHSPQRKRQRRQRPAGPPTPRRAGPAHDESLEEDFDISAWLD